ncbi:MAG TPA: hypothetical protein VFQ16_14390 [Burkholderiaceae bacterium]|nr:hypothetical protein [Burkholderiaceae bacterium]
MSGQPARATVWAAFVVCISLAAAAVLAAAPVPHAIAGLQPDLASLLP